MNLQVPPCLEVQICENISPGAKKKAIEMVAVLANQIVKAPTLFDAKTVSWATEFINWDNAILNMTDNVPELHRRTDLLKDVKESLKGLPKLTTLSKAKRALASATQKVAGSKNKTAPTTENTTPAKKPKGKAKAAIVYAQAMPVQPGMVNWGQGDSVQGNCGQGNCAQGNWEQGNWGQEVPLKNPESVSTEPNSSPKTEVSKSTPKKPEPAPKKPAPAAKNTTGTEPQPVPVMPESQPVHVVPEPQPVPLQPTSEGNKQHPIDIETDSDDPDQY